MNKTLPIIMNFILLGSHISIAQNIDFLNLIESAIKAPSGHNTQPWLFRITDTGIVIMPDFSKSLPVADPEHRELYISLGCAAENLCIAAGHSGYHSRMTLERDPAGFMEIHMELTKGKAVESPLFSQIDKRQTNRSVYNHLLISRDTIGLLEHYVDTEDTGIHYYLKGTDGFEHISRGITAANRAQMRHRSFKKELISWMRFSKKSVVKQPDGLTYEVMGMPSTPPVVGKTILKAFLKPGKQIRGDLQKIESSSHLVLFTISQNDPETWIRAGQTLQRFLLETTRLRLSHSYMNSPCQVTEVGSKMMEALGFPEEHPAIILRIGFGEQQPFAPRRDVNDVISH